MRKIGIVIDSTAGYSKDEAEKLGYGFLPITIINGENQYHEGVNIDNDKVIEMLANNDNLSTSQPSFGEIEVNEKEWDKKFDHYFILCLSKGISGTYDSLRKYFDDKSDKVRVIDTFNTSWGLKRIADMLNKWMDEGIDDINELEQRANALKTKYRIYVSPENLQQLKKGGRVSAATATVADVLSIKPVIEMNNTLERVAKARGFKKAYTKIVDLIFADGKEPVDAFIAHFGGCDKNIQLAKEIYESRLGREIEVIKLSSAIGVHTGVGTLGFGSFYE